MSPINHRAYRDNPAKWLGTCVIPVGRRSWWRRVLAFFWRTR